jgi:hypothetical protein
MEKKKRVKGAEKNKRIDSREIDNSIKNRQQENRESDNSSENQQDFLFLTGHKTLYTKHCLSGTKS